MRPGDDDLIRITGARIPSGEPIIEREKPARRSGGGGARRFGAPATGGSGGYRGGSARRTEGGSGEFRSGPRRRRKAAVVAGSPAPTGPAVRVAAPQH